MYIISCNNFLAISTATYDVSIVSNPLGNPISGSIDIFQYSVGTDLSLTCLVIPTPPSDSEFSWNCSTGCFADMEMEQTVNVTELEIFNSGVIKCSVIIDDEEYFSESFEVRVLSK